MAEIPLGTGVVVHETVRVSGELADPSTAVFTVEWPDNTLVSYTDGIDSEVTHPSLGVYVLTLTPAQVPQPGKWNYKFVGTGAVEVTSYGDWDMIADPVGQAPPPVPTRGPCEPWCDAADILPYVGNVGSVDFYKYAVEASEILYDLSGRQFSGTCRKVVRPCGDNLCGAWRGVADIDGDLFWLGGFWGYPSAPWGGGNTLECGCGWLSRVLLDSYPVWKIEEVLIDGVVVDPSTYRLDEWKYLTRVRALSTDSQLYWPACQNLDLPGTQPGTFQVTYLCGTPPPLTGKEAAGQLAAQLYFAGAGVGDCQLPIGATRITRQGVTVERSIFASWARDPMSGAWSTGLALVDAFLNHVNPNGLTQPPAVFSIDRQQYANMLGPIPGGS